MFDLSTLSPNPGATKKRKRVGRGPGSGHGKTATRGHKGQKARSGGAKPPWFEGGQMPLYRRLPKRGFHNPFRVEYQIVNLDQLEARFNAGERVDKESLLAKGLIKDPDRPVKILARGSLSKALTVVADAYSEKAREAILAAGGTVGEEKEAPEAPSQGEA